jgi:hypothetical protein
VRAGFLFIALRVAQAARSQHHADAIDDADQAVLSF